MEPDPIYDGPTERFAHQRCPHCGETTLVALCLLEDACQTCGAAVEVSPLAGAVDAHA